MVAFNRALVALALLLLLQISSVAAAPTWSTFNNSNCYTGHGADNIDTVNSASPPRTGITRDECRTWCEGTSNVSACPQPVCGCIVFLPDHQGDTGTCWRRADCDPTSFEKTGKLAYTVDVRTPQPRCLPAPPSAASRNVLYIVFE